MTAHGRNYTVKREINLITVSFVFLAENLIIHHADLDERDTKEGRSTRRRDGKLMKVIRQHNQSPDGSIDHALRRRSLISSLSSSRVAGFVEKRRRWTCLTLFTAPFIFLISAFTFSSCFINFFSSLVNRWAYFEKIAGFSALVNAGTVLVARSHALMLWKLFPFQTRISDSAGVNLSLLRIFAIFLIFTV